MRLRPAMKVVTSLSILVMASSFSGRVSAEEQPGHGLQQLEKKPDAPVIQQEIKKPVPEASAGMKIHVKKFRFEGNTLFSDDELNKLVATTQGKDLTLEELKSVAELVTGKYRDAGYLIANAMVPVQNIADGIVLIKVVEGKVGEILVQGNKSYSAAFVQRYFVKVRKDPSLEEDSLERQLLLLNDYPSLTVKASLRAGKEPGTTDIIATVNDSFPISGSLSYDNFGTETTSKNRLSASLSAGNLIASGDQLALQGTIGLDKIDLDNLSYGRAEYVVPLGGSGTQVGAYYTNTIYAAGQVLSPLEISGSADIAGLYVSHPFVRKRDETLSLRFGGEYASVRDDLLGAANHRDEIRKVSLSASYDVTDRYLGRNFVGASYSRGLGELFGGSSKGTLRSTPDADNSFNKFTLDAMRIQKLPGYNHLVLRVSGQYAPDRLFLAERFNLGGEGTIRGIDPAALNGDSGLLTSIELATCPLFGDKTIFKQKVGDTIKFALFSDYGKVWTTDPQAGDPPNPADQASVGAGVRLYVGKYFTCKLDWAVPSVGGSLSAKNGKTYVQAGLAF